MGNETVKKLILMGNYIVLNKILVKELGVEAAFLLSALADGEEVAKKEGNLIDDGWFYQTVKTLEKITTLSRRKQENSLKKLLEINLIEQKNMGVPCKRYFRINTNVLLDLMLGETPKTSSSYKTYQQESTKNTNKKVQNVPASKCKKYQQESAKCTTINNININSINQENQYQEKDLDYFEKLFKKINVDFTRTNQKAILKLLKTMKKEEITSYIMELYNNLSQNPEVKNIAAVFTKNLKEGKRQLNQNQIEKINEKEKKVSLLDKFRAMDEYDRLKIEEKAIKIMNFNNMEELFELRENSYDTYIDNLKIGIIKVMQEQRLL